jgi:tetratricopeptide (TPR) repeat protein
MKRSVVWLFICGVPLITALCVAGQDLGSSNKLFGASKTKTTLKRTPLKRTRPVAKAKSSPTKARPKAPATTAKVAKPLPKTEVKKPATQTAKVDIKPSKPRETHEATVPVSAAAAELFEKLIEDGNAARDERNYLAAETAYERAKAIKPKDPRAVYGLGNLYSDQQRWDDAEKAYRAALEIDPNNAVVHVALSYVLSQPLFISDLGDRYEEAEKLAHRAIELAPSNALAFDQLGVAMELRGLISRETENAYRNAIRLDSTFAPAYAHLGRLLRRRGLLKESTGAYDTAVRLATDVGTMVLVAEVLQSEQRFADSEPLLRRAVKEDPRNPAALLLLGRALTTMGKYADAEQTLIRSMNVSPNGFMANMLLGSLYVRQAKYEQAENALLQALRFVPVSEKRRLSQEFESVGDGYVKTGKAQAAERAYRQAALLDAEKESLAGKLARARHG